MLIMKHKLKLAMVKVKLNEMGGLENYLYVN
jgi:hypothetical protein